MMKNSSLAFIDILMERYPALAVCKTDIRKALELMADTFHRGGKLLCCGNGGSAADCEHIVGELMKGFILPRTITPELAEQLEDDALAGALQYGLPTISLVSQTALSTAFANDQLPSAVFAQQVLGYGKPEDLLLCISTSGNSLNCVYAAKVAKALGLKIVSLTGRKDSKLKELSDCTILAPADETYQIQEYHLPIYHCLCLAIENEFYGE